MTVHLIHSMKGVKINMLLETRCNNIRQDPERQFKLRNEPVEVHSDRTLRTRQLASVSNMSRNSIHRIMKKLKFEPYKIHLAHQLRRQEFCEIITTRIDTEFHSQHLLFR